MPNGNQLIGPNRDRIEADRARILSLEREVRSLKEEAKLYDEFVVKCTELIPEGYDGDEAAEAIVLRYLGEMGSLGRILAQMTSGYR
jgi:hypothetical protein